MTKYRYENHRKHEAATVPESRKEEYDNKANWVNIGPIKGSENETTEELQEPEEVVELSEELSEGGSDSGFEVEIMPSKMDSQRLERWFNPLERERLFQAELEQAEEIEQSTTEEPSPDSWQAEKAKMREEWREMQAGKEDVEAEKLANIYREKDRKSSTSLYGDIAESLESGEFDISNPSVENPSTEKSGIEELSEVERNELVKAWTDRGGIWAEEAQRIEELSETKEETDTTEETEGEIPPNTFISEENGNTVIQTEFSPLQEELSELNQEIDSLTLVDSSSESVTYSFSEPPEKVLAEMV